MQIAALIVAAGRGARMDLSAARESEARAPKQYLVIGGQTVLRRTIDVFDRHPAVDSILVITHRDDGELYAAATVRCGPKLLPTVHGGSTRQSSVQNGLKALAAASPEIVLIHDAARPFVSHDEISGAIAAAKKTGGAIVAIPLADTLKRADAGNHVIETLPRDGLWRAATPQAFRYEDILAAHAEAANVDVAFTDDAAVAEHAGLPVSLVPGRPENFKLTTREDLAMAEERLKAGAAPDVRSGIGFDVHRLVPGDHVWLCGIRIPHDARLDGHSDADVGLHALTDAILGAIGDGDIGAHFPPSDPQWRGAASDQFLADAARRVSTRGGRISNVDVTLLCEAPKIGPHRDAMRARISEILAIAIDRVGVKATTTERLGFTGRGEGIAAMATATVIL
ncbi:MAG: bifunctional 2-C-methyl-D-erythritol 4-phosphate cytidylyltransferase/2-C-methyl-D-erythritol 2,4-cyclodiphosphate synthase [Pseudomonadota bacterium]